jgi:transcriptional regulator with XRE-family HTH domain
MPPLVDSDDSIDYSNLAHNLRLCRLEQRKTQRELARQADGLSQVYLCRLEHGLWPTRPEHVERLAKALGVPTSVLLGRARRIRGAHTPPARERRR